MFENKIEGNVLAIADVHGDIDKLTKLIKYVTDQKLHENRWIVFLGDYIDQGPESCKVIDFLTAFYQYHKKTTFCCGNHDLNLIKALNLLPNPHFDYYWHRIPSRNATTLSSYKVTTASQLLEIMPYSHKEFFKNLVWHVEHDDYLFVHSGLSQHESYESQIEQLKKQDMHIFKPKWLHQDDLAYHIPKTNKWVITGHYILKEPSYHNNRILLDTGAGYGGSLTGLLLPEMKLIRF